MSTSAREASLTAFACDLNIGCTVEPKIVQKCPVFSESRNEALNYVENTIYFETSDLKSIF